VLFFDAAQRREISNRLARTVDNANASAGGKSLSSHIAQLKGASARPKQDKRVTGQHHRQQNEGHRRHGYRQQQKRDV